METCDFCGLFRLPQSHLKALGQFPYFELGACY